MRILRNRVTGKPGTACQRRQAEHFIARIKYEYKFFLCSAQFCDQSREAAQLMIAERSEPFDLAADNKGKTSIVKLCVRHILPF
jgi:hypothetical protein